MVVKKGRLDQQKRTDVPPSRPALSVRMSRRSCRDGAVSTGIIPLPNSGAGGSRPLPLPRRAPAPRVSTAITQLRSHRFFY
jgi:hypothetical protein